MTGCTEPSRHLQPFAHELLAIVDACLLHAKHAKRHQAARNVGVLASIQRLPACKRRAEQRVRTIEAPQLLEYAPECLVELSLHRGLGVEAARLLRTLLDHREHAQ